MEDPQANSPGPTLPPRRVRARDAAVAALNALIIVGLGLLLWQLAPLLLMVFAGALAAILLRALAEGTAHWTALPYSWSLGLVLFLIFSMVAAGTFLGGQVIANQMVELTDQVPQSLEKLREQISQYPWGKRLVRAAPTSPEEMPLSSEDAASYATGALAGIGAGLTALVIVLFLGIYLAIDPGSYVNGLIRLAPVGKRPRLGEVLEEVHHALRWWLLGKIVAMLIVGVSSTVGLALLGVRLAVALGVIAAVLTFVPNFGPVISAIPAVLLAFVESPMTAVYVILLYLAIQTVESYLITPLIQQRTVSLPPVLTISAQLGMGLLFGAGGVVVATPLAAAALVVINRLYVEDALESPNR